MGYPLEAQAWKREGKGEQIIKGGGSKEGGGGGEEEEGRHILLLKLFVTLKKRKLNELPRQVPGELQEGVLEGGEGRGS